MRNFSLFVFLLTLCACAGNPPDWWNPSGTYGTSVSVKNSGTAAVSKKQASYQQNQVEIPSEEAIETSVEEYEEITLNPTEQIDSSATGENSEQTDPMYAPAGEHLPTDGSLPPPTVLE